MKRPGDQQSRLETHLRRVSERLRITLERSAPRLRFATSALVVLVSAIPFVRFLSAALARLTYPFDLEWCEGGVLEQIRMILEGHQPFQKPSWDFTSYIYTPLYYYASALLSLVLGWGHLAPRIVSFCSILGCFYLLARWVRDETGDLVAGLASVGLLCAVYPLTGYWFELVRVDSFFLLMVFGTLTLARRAGTDKRAAVVGVFIAATVFTKQLGIPMALPALLLVAVHSVRRAIIAGVVAAGLLLTVGLVFQFLSDGWFVFFVLKLPSQHRMQWERLAPSLHTFFVSSTFPMTIAGLAILCGFGFPVGAWRRWLCHAAIVVVACTSSFLPFLKTGGYPNGLIPAYASLALVSGIALAALRKGSSSSALGGVGASLAALTILAVQVATLDDDTSKSVPSAADLAANKEVMARMARLPRPIYTTGPIFYAMSVENRVLADTMGLTDIYKAGGKQAEILDAELTNAIRTHRFQTIIIDRAGGFLPPHLLDLIRQEYVQKGSVLDGLPPDVIWPKSGASLRPDAIWIAK